MWQYTKMMEYPLNITKKDLKMAKNILSQYGGPQGELGAALRYLNQRITMPDEMGKAVLNDIGTEELAHVEMLQAMVNALVKDATIDELKAEGLDSYFTEHGKDIFPANSDGVNFTTDYISSVGDPIANIVEDMAAEQKARAVYEHLILLTNNQEIIQPLLFLRQREIVHYERFSELLEHYRKMGY
jgi:spore coat protein JC